MTTVERSDVATETPLPTLLQRLTPNDAFYVRNHARAVPQIAGDAYRLEVEGSNGTAVLRLADLRGLPRVAEIVTLSCAGNGRTAFDPLPAGVPWGFGAIATARWDGVRLRDVLDVAGLRAGAQHVTFAAYDEAPSPAKPPYRRSIPLARALAAGTIVADTMNGQALPAEHGGPVRLVVAGWTANHSMKWLRHIALADEPDQSSWMTDDYRVAGADGALEMLEETAPVAILAHPVAGAVRARELELQGIAYGEPTPTRVRVEIDGEHAGDAPVRYDDGSYAWGRWSLAATFTPGERRIVCRPVDAAGNAGPLRATWNAKGYRYDGPHVVVIDVA